MRRQHLLVVLIILSVCIVARADEPTVESLVGQAAPDVSLSTLDGKTASLKDERGHVVVMDFWATWCGPCKLALPNLQALSDDAELQKRGLRIWAVNCTGWKPETHAKAQAHVESQKYHLTVPMDEQNAVRDAYHLDTLPRTVIVGRDGKVFRVLAGFDAEKPEESKAELRAAIDEALKQQD